MMVNDCSGEWILLMFDTCLVQSPQVIVKYCKIYSTDLNSGWPWTTTVGTCWNCGQDHQADGPAAFQRVPFGSVPCAATWGSSSIAKIQTSICLPPQDSTNCLQVQVWFQWFASKGEWIQSAARYKGFPVTANTMYYFRCKEDFFEADQAKSAAISELRMESASFLLPPHVRLTMGCASASDWDWLLFSFSIL